MAATTLEGQKINGEGPSDEQLTYENALAFNLSISNHEVFGLPSDSSKIIACIMAAATGVATPGTLKIGETGQIWIAGRFRVPKDTSVALTQGHTTYWDFSTNKATTNAVADQATDFALGLIVKTASTATAFVEVDLNTGPLKYDIGT